MRPPILASHRRQGVLLCPGPHLWQNILVTKLCRLGVQPGKGTEQVQPLESRESTDDGRPALQLVQNDAQLLQAVAGKQEQEQNQRASWQAGQARITTPVSLPAPAAQHGREGRGTGMIKRSAQPPTWSRCSEDNGSRSCGLVIRLWSR